MKSISSSLIVVATALLGASTVSAGARTLLGCFSSTTNLALNDSTVQFNSVGSCGDICGINAITGGGMHENVFGTANKSMCYCGNDIPPASTKVDSTLCNIACPGFPSDICGGGTQYISVYLSGVVSSVSSGGSDSESNSATKGSSPSATTSAKPSVVTIGGQTIVVTAPSTPTPSGGSSPSGASKAGIAAGVVVGIIAIAAIGGGIYLYIRNKQRREVEEEYRRNAAVSSFMAGKPPTSSGGASSFNDMRLDPAVMAQRRMSDGSIADNQDYSRRILKVTNA